MDFVQSYWRQREGRATPPAPRRNIVCQYSRRGAVSRGIGKLDMVHNSATPKIEVDPETYEVRADGELLTCEPAQVLPLAQRYFLF